MRLLFAALLSIASAAAVHLTASRAYAHDYSIGQIEIGHPIVAPPPNGVNVTAGYLVLRNRGDSADRLVSASSPGAARIEIHETTQLPNGAVRMTRLPQGVVLAAHSETAFAPGGLHLMVIDIDPPLAEGGRLPLILEFEHAGRVEVTAYVERPRRGSQAGQTHMH